MEDRSKSISIRSGLRPVPGREAQELNRLIARLEEHVLGAAGHSRRVARYAAATAARMGMSPERVERVRLAGVVHDVGKIETPEEIVNKPGPLSEEEFVVLELHAGAGAEMVAGLGDEELARIVRHHHERFDGRGYPDRLAGGRIPLGARIVAVADTFDALTSMRPYRPAMRYREALELLGAEAGAQLDPSAVAAFGDYYVERRESGAQALAR
jgi:putative nucleotidyltransferase with HDIG domain